MPKVLTRTVLACATAALLLAGTASDGRAQTNRSQSSLASYSTYRDWSTRRPSTASNPAMDYFGGANVRTPQTPKIRMPAPEPVKPASRTKPFSGVQPSPTISPYLGLNTFQTEGTIPNYYTLVRPMLQQEQINRSQRAQISRMQHQIHSASNYGIAAPNPQGGIPTTGHSTQFQNMGAYYPGAEKR